MADLQAGDLRPAFAGRAQLLSSAKERAEQMARVKEDFLAVATHEIRAPVNAIAGAVNRLAQLVREREQRELVQITREIDPLLQLRLLAKPRCPAKIKEFLFTADDVHHLGLIGARHGERGLAAMQQRFGGSDT